ncbi:drug/metabolite transporter (DMT)-like permease [Alteromonadaceae bacterium 2753L.S.0a.02]|nr:drug/metabolite transporter (DMT)-like permease [Alteromonadaceae bacterium 2753L.S.0a.02]
MPVIFAYIFVVFIWATTPLAIQWSNSSLEFVTAVTIRMILALAICLALMIVFRIPLVKRKSDWIAFLAGMLGLYPNMLIVYWSAQYISSGLMAVILGLYPFAVGFFSLLFTRENVFNPMRIIALATAILGLAIINFDQLTAGSDAIYGVLGMVGSSLLFALSSVWVKAVGATINPLRQSTGVLVLSVPAFALTWFFVDGKIPEEIDMKSLVGISYLSVAGSVIGHTLFYYVLRHCSMVSVSLIPLITPVMALSIGVLLANEKLSGMSMLGVVVVLAALGIYQGVFKHLTNPRRLRQVIDECKLFVKAVVSQ